MRKFKQKIEKQKKRNHQSDQSEKSESKSESEKNQKKKIIRISEIRIFFKIQNPPETNLHQKRPLTPRQNFLTFVLSSLWDSALFTVTHLKFSSFSIRVISLRHIQSINKSSLYREPFRR